MIPISGKLKDDLEKKYRKRRNLPKNGVKKPVLSECANCKHYERWDNGKDLHWCVSKYFDRIEKRQVTRYQNIELLKICPKAMCRK
jgi:hypothetical protein